MINVDFAGMNRQMRDLAREVTDKMQRASAEASFDAAAIVDSHFKFEYARGTKSGEFYTRGIGRTHRASVNASKVEYPALDFGALGQNTSASPLPNGSAEVATRSAYAEFLHFGTRHMRPRKSVIDAADEKAQDIEEAYKQRAQEALRR